MSEDTRSEIERIIQTAIDNGWVSIRTENVVVNIYNGKVRVEDAKYDWSRLATVHD